MAQPTKVMADRIKPEELRIGNLVFDERTKTICVVDGIQYSGRIVTHDKTYDDYKRGLDPVGIPLSKDWLERFGFDVATTVGGFEKWELPNGFKLLDGKHPAFMYFRPVQYVHQLQNLYFSLTSTELQLKEQTSA